MSSSKKRTKKRRVIRSAVTGRFKSKRHLKRNPRTTVTERV